MGIVNVTPDSFSGDGLEDGIPHAHDLIRQGAQIIDIGGESSRPSAVPVSEAEEWQRISETVTVLASETVVSVDTAKASIAHQALERGTHIINDIGGGKDSELLQIVAEAKAGYILMHNMRDRQPLTTDPVTHLFGFFKTKLAELGALGISAEQVVFDPGLGFGWSQDENYYILANLPRLIAGVNRPILIGASRKGFIGAVTGQKMASERVAGSVAAALSATTRGAEILRVHDVKDTREALQVWQAIHA
jgi:dihydropteroate synthase